MAGGLFIRTIRLMADIQQLQDLAKLIRYFILVSTAEAGSGHPSSSMSATDLMTAMMFGGFFRADLNDPANPNNDRLIFSKGHASPLFYALYAAAGKVTEDELKTLRKFGSRLEGHPTMYFPYTEAATGSLGQGLSVGVGMALNAKYIDKLPYKTFVLLGDSEVAEGSVWEAAASAAHYNLDNLIGILDVNRLGQRGETMFGHDIQAYEDRFAAFGWNTVVIDGHDMEEVVQSFNEATQKGEAPTMIIAKTMKGKGVQFMENTDGWHGKAPKKEELDNALAELGAVDKNLRGEVLAPEKIVAADAALVSNEAPAPAYPIDKLVATRRAYGNALVRIYSKFPQMVVLDAEVSNSTYSEFFKEAHPERFFEMFIAEQNMVGVALGFSRRGKIPFISTFAAFLTRAYDQIRMCQYADANIKIAGSHAGVSIGEDGASQMALEDLAMFRAVMGSTVLYPSDAFCTEKLMEEAAMHKGMVYIRTTRKDTPILYGPEEKFPIGGSKVLKQSSNDVAAVVAAGVTLFEALKAYDELAKGGIFIRVIDAYSIKPIDATTMQKAAQETKKIITVEDHFEEGGLGEAVKSALAGNSIGEKFISLAVRKMPRSGKPEELLAYEEIDSAAIVKAVKG